MLTQEAMLNLASELTDADADGDATSLAAIAWRLYRVAGENLTEVGRLRAAIHHVWNRPQKSHHRHRLPPECDQGRHPAQAAQPALAHHPARSVRCRPRRSRQPARRLPGHIHDSPGV